MSGGLLNARVAGAELSAAEDVATSHDDRDLHAAIGRLDRLPGDVDDLVHADPPFAGAAERLAREF